MAKEKVKSDKTISLRLRPDTVEFLNEQDNKSKFIEFLIDAYRAREHKISYDDMRVFNKLLNQKIFENLEPYEIDE